MFYYEYFSSIHALLYFVDLSCVFIMVFFESMFITMSENLKKNKAAANDTQASKATKVSPTVTTPQNQPTDSTHVSKPSSQLSSSNVSEDVMQPIVPTHVSKSSFQPPSPNRGFGFVGKSKSKSFPTVEVMYDPVALLGFVEVVPIVSKKTQYLGSLSFPPTLSDIDAENIQKTLMSNGFFIKVFKADNGTLVSEDKVSTKTGKQYTVYQSMFVFWIDGSHAHEPQLDTYASTFLDVSFGLDCIIIA